MAVGGVPVCSLAERFGTPLYVFDEEDLRTRARRFRRVFAAVYPASRVVYAAKAYLSPALAALLWEEGVGLDVVSGGELFVGRAGGVPAAAMTFHGNNKSEAELREALVAEIGLIAVDNEREIDLLAALVAGTRRRQPVLLRLNPNVEAVTHEKMRTGSSDSKFGFPVETGEAEAAVGRVVSVPGLELVGYHVHVGSQVFDAELVARTIEAIVDFAAAMRVRHGIVPSVVSPGGGFGVSDDASGADVSIEQWARNGAKALLAACDRHRLPAPELIVEPGRAIIGPAGVAVYRVGSRKEIPAVRTYVSVDGGMGDNIRASLYGARYTAAVANRASTGPHETVTIAGKYCESGDVLIEAVTLPRLRPDDLLAVPMAGAYCLAMASVYNLVPRPAVVMVKDGAARLLRRRETYDDLLTLDLPVDV
jgi:diaminopimelate decarboxylase